MTSRCAACGDPAPSGWQHCFGCHAWNDLSLAFRFGEIGLDEFRLRRARDYFAFRNREPLEKIVARLRRRIRALEQENRELNDALEALAA